VPEHDLKWVIAASSWTSAYARASVGDHRDDEQR
jgi:hypothetical protein